MALSIHGHLPAPGLGPADSPRAPHTSVPQRDAAGAGAGAYGATPDGSSLRQAEASGAASRTARGAATNGVDPAVWALLSGEERDFYARHAVSGPTTYGPGAQPAPSRQLGTRVDIRV